MSDDLSCIMVIFGGTGDLTHRKLMPALYNLQVDGMLPNNFAVVSIGRREKTNDEYRSEVYESIKKFSRFEMKEHRWDQIKDRIYYQQFDFDDDEGYIRLNGFLKELDEKYNSQGNRLYYLSVSPQYFDVIVEKLNIHEMAQNEGSWKRVVIEKPFGMDLQSARYLNKRITDVFKEENTYRIDHYLGKEMLQNIMVIRFSNMLFEPTWNNQFIDNIQISSSETVGVGTRGGYYEQAGALRDMLQNHMLQLLTLIAMEPPVDLKTESVRDEKVKVLRALQEFTPEMVRGNVVRGQYGPGIIDNQEVWGYRQEEKVDKSSDTETFLALKVQIENFRWGGVPFYIRTGKMMPAKSTEVVIQYKSLPKILYSKENKDLEPNLLVIRIQPEEGVFFQFNAKKPGTIGTTIPVQADFSHSTEFGNNTPEAYERLLSDVMKGESTLFTRWDEVEYSWKFIDTIAETWLNEKNSFPNYKAGTWGPKEADELLARDNRKWWNIGEIKK